MKQKNDRFLTVSIATVAMVVGILLGVWTQQGVIEDARNGGYATGWEDGNNEGYFEGYDLGYEDGLFSLAEESLTDFMNGFDEGWNAAVDSIYY